MISNVLLDSNGETINENAQQAFPLLVSAVLPIGIRGVVVAGLLAALMSSLAGVFNASSTLFTMDFYSKLKPKSSQEELVKVGRIATIIMIFIGLMWIPVIQGSRGLYNYLQSVQGYLAPPIFTVFFFGVANKRLNAKGCLSALTIGFIMGLFRLAVDTPVSLMSDFSYKEGTFFWVVNNIFFQYYSLLIFIVSAITMVVVSYFTEEPDKKSIKGLTFFTLSEDQKNNDRSSVSTNDIVMTIVVLLLILFAYIYFSG